MYVYEREYDPFENDDDCNSFGQQLKVCSYCGEANLHWEDFGSGWKLYDANDDRHLCQCVEPNADDFEVL